MRTRRIPSNPLALAILLVVISFDPASAYEQSFSWGGGNGFMGSNQNVAVTGQNVIGLPTAAYYRSASASSSTNLCYRTFNFSNGSVVYYYYPGNGSDPTRVYWRSQLEILTQTIQSNDDDFRSTRDRSVPVVGHGVTLVSAGVGIGPFNFKLNAGGWASTSLNAQCVFTPIGPGVRPTVSMSTSMDNRVVGWINGGIDIFIGAGGVNSQIELAYLSPRLTDQFYTAGPEIRTLHSSDLIYNFGALNVWAWGRIGPKGFSYNWSQNVVSYAGFGGNFILINGNENIFTLSAAPPSRSTLRPTFRKGSSRPTFLTPNYPSILR